MDIMSFYKLVQIVSIVLLALPVAYIFWFAFWGLFYRQQKYPEVVKFRKIAVLIPGYKEDEVIVEVAEQALKQNYPQENYDVVIIADSFQAGTLAELKTLPIKVIEVSFDKSTKAKALNKAMSLLDDNYEIAVILDADNIMGNDFLLKINASFEWNFKAVQGHRTAKNMNTPLAILDSASEEINNHIFRKGHRVLCLSSAIIGSGMAFDYPYFKQMMADIKAIGGFDKEIELKMLKQGHKIGYLDDAMVYDEKVQKDEVFTNQRRRWLSAQLHYFRQDIGSAIFELFKRGNFDYFDKAIQFVQPPRILLLGAVILAAIIFSSINLSISISMNFHVAWAILSVTVFLAFLFSVPRSFYNLQTLKALASLPKGMFLMFRSLLKIKGANQRFLHTKHTASTPKNNPEL